MADNKKRKEVQYRTADFFVIRAPILPVSRYFDWHPKGDSVQEKTAAVLRLLERTMEDAIIREGIFLASPALYRAWEKHRNELGNATPVVRSLMRYFARMTSRATPFGLFAGHCIGSWDTGSNIVLSERSTNERYTQPDSGYIARLGAALQAQELNWPQLKWWPNTSWYNVNGGYKYIKQTIEGTDIRNSLLFVEESEFVEAAISCAQSGASISELIAHIVSAGTDEEGEVTREEAYAFLSELIRTQILSARLVPISSGPSPFDDFLSALPQSEVSKSCHAALSHLSDSMRSLDEGGVGARVQLYEEMQRSLEAGPGEPSIDRLFQVDMVWKTEEAKLSCRVRRELERSVLLLGQLQTRRNTMQGFIESFVEKFGEREVPLLQALDPEEGICFGTKEMSAAPTPLLNDISFAAVEKTTTHTLSPSQKWFLKRIREENGDELVLSKQDVAELSENIHSLPDSFSLFATLIAPSVEEMDTGEFQIVVQVLTGPSGATGLGRFCHSNKELSEKLDSYLLAEEALHPDVIFAEVVHLPEGRMANVIARPGLRAHEISFLGKSSAVGVEQISPSDLWIRIEKGRVVLFSRTLGKIVVPRISNMHRFDKGASLYQFLGQLQSQDQYGYFFHWGDLPQMQKKLPRVRCGRVILAAAQWRLDRWEIKQLNIGTVEERFQWAQELRCRRNLPKLVSLVDDDNRLLVDFDNPLSVDAFVHFVRQREQCTLAECIGMTPETQVVEGHDGKYTHELIVPFTRVKQQKSVWQEATVEFQEQPDEEAVVTDFSLGSEWLYYKLYTTPRCSDLLLKDYLEPLIREWQDVSILQNWFFIRYEDPKYHLRVRFQGKPSVLLESLVPQLYAVLEQAKHDGVVESVCLDTYTREISRYGGADSISAAEALFCADSEMYLKIVEQLEGDDGVYRWQLCIRGLDQYLDDFGCTLLEKRDIMGDLRTRYRNEFFADSSLSKKMGARYRLYSKAIAAVLDRDSDLLSPFPLAISAFHNRSSQIGPFVAHYKRKWRKAESKEDIRKILISFLHMQCNRFSLVEGRAHELLLYDFMFRAYDTKVFRDSQKSRI